MKTIKKHPNIPKDEGTMLGWFANSIMAGYDFVMKQFSTQFGMNKREDELTPSEAIYGFCAWLTTKDEETIMGSHHDCTVVVDRIVRFLDVNNLSTPREGYEQNLIFPIE